MDDCNNHAGPADTPEPEPPLDKNPNGPAARLLRWSRHRGQQIRAGFWQSAGSHLGSGAVSLLILWIQSRSG